MAVAILFLKVIKWYLPCLIYIMDELKRGLSHRTCSVCKSNKGPMFCFPKEPEKRESWRVFLGLESATKYMQICSSHFRSEDLKAGNGRYRLVRNAFPHIKVPESVKPSRCHTHRSAKPTCIVPGCGNTGQDGVSLHRFPRLFERRHQWASLIKAEKVPSGNSLICSSHFLPTDFRTTGTQKLLRSCATPSVNLEVPLNNSLGRAVCQVIEGGTSDEEIGGVLMSSQGDSRSGQPLSNSLHNSVELPSTVGLTVINRDSGSVCNKEGSFEERYPPLSLPEKRPEEDLHVSFSSKDKGNSDLSVPACFYVETSLGSEAEESTALEEVLNSTSGNDAEETSSVFKRLSDRIKADISNIVNSPLDSSKSRLNTVTSFSNYDKSCSTQTEPLKFDLFDQMHSDSQLKAFTGVTYTTFNCLLKLVLELCHDVDNAKVPMRKKILLTLCKLRLNLSYECLSVLVGIDRWKCRSYFTSTLHLVAVVLRHTVIWPSKREMALNMPKCFQEFKGTRVVLHCFEMPIVSPDCLKCRIRLFTHYKCCQTVKVLLGVAPSGLIIFVSRVYRGRASDKQIFEESDLLSKLEPHVDAVVVDKGFRIDDACKKFGIKVYRPPFILTKQPLNEVSAKRNSETANARACVEHVIQRIRTFKILQSEIALPMVPYLNEIIVVIAGLVNLSPAVLPDDKFIT